MADVTDEGESLEVMNSHRAQVGHFDVRRALPQRRRRTVGAWCFADHMGPADVTEGSGLDIGPHPHTGLQTVTWLIDGQALHRDSLGSEQVISAGELNLMSAGRGVSHAEEATGHYRGTLQGIQLWIAQDESERHGDATFEHHDDLPRVETTAARATVLVGRWDGATSPVGRATSLLGVDLRLDGTTGAALDPSFEHSLIVLEGLIEVDGRELGPGTLGYLGVGRDELTLTSHGSATVILVGGVPLNEEIVMWWNFVARSRDEIDAAYDAWRSDDGRFGTVHSPLDRVMTSGPWWRSEES